MTDERMALIELIEKQADSDFVRDMLAFAADRIMEMEVEARTGATSGDHQTRQRLSPANADPRSASGTAIIGQREDADGRLAARIALASAHEHCHRRAGGEDGQDHLGGAEKRLPLRDGCVAVGRM